MMGKRQQNCVSARIENNIKKVEEVNIKLPEIRDETKNQSQY